MLCQIVLSLDTASCAVAMSPDSTTPVLLAGVVLLSSLAGASSGIGGVRAADRFWNGFAYEGRQAENYESMAEMARASDLVITGRIRETTLGRTIRPGEPDEVQYVNLTLDVDVVLAGRLAGASVTLEMWLLDPRDFASALESAPTSTTLFFLRNKGTEAAVEGWGQAAVERESKFYRLVNVGQAVYSDIDDRAYPPSHAEDQWVKDVRGANFGSLVADVKAAPRANRESP